MQREREPVKIIMKKSSPLHLIFFIPKTLAANINLAQATTFYRLLPPKPTIQTNWSPSLSRPLTKAADLPSFQAHHPPKKGTHCLFAAAQHPPASQIDHHGPVDFSSLSLYRCHKPKPFKLNYLKPTSLDSLLHSDHGPPALHHACNISSHLFSLPFVFFLFLPSSFCYAFQILIQFFYFF